MGKMHISSSKGQSFKRKASRTVMSSNSLSDAADSNSDSGLDIEVDSENRDEHNVHEPLFVFKNPSISSYEHAMDKLLLPILQSKHAHQGCEPPFKKTKLGRAANKCLTEKVPVLTMSRRPNHHFSVQTSSPTNYADFLLEEANLGYESHGTEELPHLQTVLKSIFREDNSTTAAREEMATQTKVKNPSKCETERLQMDSTHSDTIVNSVSRNAPTMTTSANSSSRRVPLARRQLTLCLNIPSKSKNGKIELRILSQPEEQHRARYLTEGSRGAVKDRVGSGYPTVKLFGYYKPVTLQVFIGTDQGKVQPHLFYQASKVCGKNSVACSQKKIEGTVILEMALLPEKDMTLSCDCVGILKERNVDVEQRLLHFGGTRNKKRSTKCRLIFRALIGSDDCSGEILQAASAPIVCTQPPGIPEICRKSLSGSESTGNVELFIIGKNFLKDTKVLFEECSRDNVDDSSFTSNPEKWKKIVLPEKDFLQPNHLICTVPPFRDTTITHPVRVRLLVQSSGKRSEPQNFTYLPISHGSPSVCKLQEHSEGSMSTDMAPTLIHLAPSQHQSLPTSTMEQNMQLKQEERNQPTLITTVVIPDMSQRNALLSQAATAHILQDTQQALQSVTNSALGLPMKTSHIQVLVMPASSTVSVTTAPDSSTQSISVQNSILDSLKSEITSDIINACESQESMHKLQSHYPSNNFLEANSRIRQFANLNTKPQTIRELLMKDQTKIDSSAANTISFRDAIVNAVSNINGKVDELRCQNMSLQNSLESGLGCSLESIPMHSLMQSKNSDVLQEQKVVYSQNCNLGNAGSNGSFLLTQAKPKVEGNFGLTSSMEGNSVCMPICSTGSFNLPDNGQAKEDIVLSCTTDQRAESCQTQGIIHMTNFECLNSQVDSLLNKQNIQGTDQIHDSTTADRDHQFNSPFSVQEERLFVQNTLNDIANANSDALIASKVAFINASKQEVSDISMPCGKKIQLESVNTLGHGLCNTVCISDGSIVNFSESDAQTVVSTSHAMIAASLANTGSLNFQDQYRISVTKPSTPCITTYSLTEPTFYFQESFNAPQKTIQSSTLSKDLFQLSTTTETTSTNSTPESALLTTSSVANPDQSMILNRDFLEPDIRSALSSLISATSTQSTKNIQNTIIEDQSSLSFEPKFSTSSVFSENGSATIEFMNMQSNNTIIENKYQLCSSEVGNIQSSPGKMLEALTTGDTIATSASYSELGQTVTPACYPSVQQNNEVVQDQSGLFPNASELEISTSKSSSSQQSTTSMDQMSTIMSLLPETELLKFINPSTFDKI